MAQLRKYATVHDFNDFPLFGPEDGTQYAGVRVLNLTSYPNINTDGSAGVIGDLGTKDSDLFALLGVQTYGKCIVANSPSADQTIDVRQSTRNAKQVLIDNQGSATACFVEWGDTAAANTNCPSIPSGQAIIMSVNTDKIHIWTANPSSVIVRSWG